MVARQNRGIFNVSPVFAAPLIAVCLSQIATPPAKMSHQRRSAARPADHDSVTTGATS
jgi:hypothetical protein